MSPTTVDVLLAVYNGEAYLAALLDSLLAQTVSDFRLVVSNNRSTDATQAILDSYRERFKGGLETLPIPESTVSASANFARVTQAGRADYVMFADADDVWHSDKIEKTLQRMKSREAALGASTPMLVHSDLAVVDRTLEPIHPSFWRYQKIDPHRTRLDQLLLRNCVTGCTMMINRSLLELGSPVPPQAIMHDYWFALVASALGHIEAIEEPLLDYRQHGANDTGAKRWSAGFVWRQASALRSHHGPRGGLRRKIAQAGVLLERYDDRMSLRDRHVLAAFASLSTKSGLGRRLSLVRHGFVDDGLMRTVGLYIAI